MRAVGNGSGVPYLCGVRHRVFAAADGLAPLREEGICWVRWDGERQSSAGGAVRPAWIVRLTRPRARLVHAAVTSVPRVLPAHRGVDLVDLTCRGTWARVTIDHFRRVALQTCMGTCLLM